MYAFVHVGGVFAVWVRAYLKGEKMKILNAALKFRGALRRRSATSEIVLHHTAVSALQSVGVIHNYYLNRSDDSFSGIGYNFYVRKDGTVWEGRPLWAVGGHCVNHNFKSVGICFEGNFEKEKMGAKQFDSGVELIKYVLKAYPGCKIYRHKDLGSTACPGKNFPFEKMVKAATGKKSASTKEPGLKVGDKVKITGKYAASAYSAAATHSAAVGAARYIVKIYKGAPFPYRLATSKFNLLSRYTTGFAAAGSVKKI